MAPLLSPHLQRKEAMPGGWLCSRITSWLRGKIEALISKLHRPYHHYYCKGSSPEVLQCLWFESTDPNAQLTCRIPCLQIGHAQACADENLEQVLS